MPTHDPEPEWMHLYRRWMKLANPEGRATNRQVYPDVERRKQERIAKAKEAYEKALAKFKAKWR